MGIAIFPSQLQNQGLHGEAILFKFHCGEYDWFLALEFINRAIGKPQLTDENITDLRLVYFAFLRFLHYCGVKVTINYKVFLHQAFKTLKIDYVIFTPFLTNKERVNDLERLWYDFTQSIFFQNYKFEKEYDQDIDKQFDVLLSASAGGDNNCISSIKFTPA
ncbi:hypothetical protein, partial [Bartonella sp. CL46QHWL]|uniref:hypothetical protein n=1 Tax=Bartonella sp. CL46QHWL TaxID=3243534 RepID=UPI0035CF2102